MKVRRAAIVVLAVVVVAGGLEAAFLARRYAAIDRVDIAKGVLASRPGRGQPQNYLLVGTDSRAFVGDNPLDAAAYGTDRDVGPPHADTILLVRTFPSTGKVALVSFPRDLWIPISGTGTSERINTAIQGGPARLVRTITEDFGIKVHHYVEVDFRGFKGLVNSVGGVDVPFATPARDWDEATQHNPTGFEVAAAGCIRLDGDRALAYVRSRHYQQFVDGAWRPDPAGDLNRIARQQDFIRRILGRALSRGLLNPFRVNRLTKVAVESVILDQRLGLRDMASLGRQLRRGPEALHAYAVATTPGRTPAGADVLFLDEGAATPVLDVFRGVTDEPAVLLPGDVRVQVLDTSPTRARAATAAYRLAAAGFAVQGTAASAERPARTTVRYPPGSRAAADLLASHLAGRATLVEDPARPAGDALTLTLGADWRGTTTATAADAGPPAAPAPAPPAPPTSLSVANRRSATCS